MPDESVYEAPFDTLVEHYAMALHESGRAQDMKMARMMVDTSGHPGLLGRITETDVAKGYDPRYVRLRALVLAGLATDEEQAEWDREMPETDEGMAELVESAVEDLLPPEQVSEEEMQTLREHLWEIRRIGQHEKALKEAKAGHTKAAVPVLKRIGSVMIADPVDGKPRITNVIEAETLVVDQAELFEALLEHYGDEDQAYLVWKETLKPPAVDTKDEGLFHQATKPRGENGELPPLIPPEVVAKVARFKKSAAYVGFAKPGG